MLDLDDAYANGPHIRGAQWYPDMWLRRSQAFRDQAPGPVTLHDRYGDSERQYIDYFETPEPPKGTVVFIHGGYWRGFAPEFWHFLAAGPLRRGWSVAMPGYDLCPQVSLGEIVAQTERAIMTIAARNTGPISVTGHSAGGTLAARLLDRNLLDGSVATRLQSVVPISPLSDLAPLMETEMNSDLLLTRQQVRDHSPVYLQDRWPVAVTVVVGQSERPAFRQQARALCAAWNAPMMEVPALHHFDIIEPLADPSSRLTRLLTG